MASRAPLPHLTRLALKDPKGWKKVSTTPWAVCDSDTQVLLPYASCYKKRFIIIQKLIKWYRNWNAMGSEVSFFIERPSDDYQTLTQLPNVLAKSICDSTSSYRMPGCLLSCPKCAKNIGKCQVVNC